MIALRDRAVEEVASSRNDLLIVFDELNRIGGKPEAVRQRIRDLTYRLAGGRGKIRSGVVKDTLPNLTWMLFGIVTWEDKKKDQRELRGGQVRLIRIAVPDASDGGIFDGLTEGAIEKTARGLAREVDTIITENCGVALVPYLNMLVADRTDWTAEAATIVERFVNQVAAEGSAWEKRFARKFGIVLAAALLAVKARVAPWNEHHARQAIEAVYFRALAAISSPEEATGRFLVEIKKRVKRKKYFPRVDEGQRLPRDHASIWGIRRNHRTLGQIAAVRMSRVSRLVPDKELRKAVLHCLQVSGVRATGPGTTKVTVQLKVLGFSKRHDRVRFLCLDRKELDKHAG